MNTRRAALLRWILALSGLNVACSASHPTVLDAALPDAGAFDVFDADTRDSGPIDSGARDAGADAGTPPCEPECEATCAEAAARGASVGCDFVVLDLDNAAGGAGRDASGQPLGITVANPGAEDAEVTIERSSAAVGAPPVVVAIVSRTVRPRTAEFFILGEHELDGSTPAGLNDGTHTAITANGLRVRSTRPVAVYQLNPSANTGVFSNDGSLVLPVHALGTRYGVVAWPQTIGPELGPGIEQLRSFLTIAATAAGTHVTVTLGSGVVRVVGAGAIPASGPGSVIEVDLGAFEVLNLETDAFTADFSGSRVEATAPVAVFVGSEASDVPHFTRIEERQCCGDHLETQLAPDDRAGRQFVIARMRSRGEALNVAFGSSTVAEIPDTDWVRVIALEPGMTTITTTLAAPRDRFVLAQGAWTEIRADADFVLDASARVSVLQALPSQAATGIPMEYPGGDPSLFWVPAVEHHRAHAAFAIPEFYAFDAIVIVSHIRTSIELDGAPLPAECVRAAIGPEWQVHRCPMSFPRVLTSGIIDPGIQRDGFHVVFADRPVGLVVEGWDAFVSYAFAGGATLPLSL